MRLCACGCGQPTSRVKQREGEYVAGDYRRYARGHWKRRLVAKLYAEAPVSEDGRRRHVHRARAEAALGKPLPDGAVVHHADGSTRPDAPLVICQDEAYHRLLHVRMRVLLFGGDPNTDAVCSHCKIAKPLGAFHKDRTSSTGHYKRCKACRTA